MRLRAAQAAYFVNGVLLEVHDIRGAPKPIDIPAVGLTRVTADKIRRLVTPSSACAITVAAAGATPAELAKLKIHDVDDDGSQVTVGDRRLDIPTYAASLIRAQLLARRNTETGDPDTLLVNDKGVKFNPYPLARRMQNAAQLAAIWSPSDESRPPWQQQSPAGHSIKLLAFSANWDAVSQPP